MIYLNPTANPSCGLEASSEWLPHLVGNIGYLNVQSKAKHIQQLRGKPPKPRGERRATCGAPSEFDFAARYAGCERCEPGEAWQCAMGRRPNKNA